jgi:hypothetical protein
MFLLLLLALFEMNNGADEYSGIFSILISRLNWIVLVCGQLLTNHKLKNDIAIRAKHVGQVWFSNPRSLKQGRMNLHPV